jgi:hypothetical protein
MRSLIPLLSVLILPLFTPNVAPAGGDPAGTSRWEYRVLSKEQVLELGNKDLAAGLNRLGIDRWELAAVDGAYIFKRRVLEEESVENKKRRLTQAQDRVDQQRDRVAWSERMVRKGFLSETQLHSEKATLAQAELTLELAQRDYDAHVLPQPRKDAPTKK